MAVPPDGEDSLAMLVGLFRSRTLLLTPAGAGEVLRLACCRGARRFGREGRAENKSRSIVDSVISRVRRSHGGSFAVEFLDRRGFVPFAAGLINFSSCRAKVGCSAI